MLMNSSAGAPLRSMQISGGIKGGVFKGLVKWLMVTLLKVLSR